MMGPHVLLRCLNYNGRQVYTTIDLLYYSAVKSISYPYLLLLIFLGYLNTNALSSFYSYIVSTIFIIDFL